MYTSVTFEKKTNKFSIFEEKYFSPGPGFKTGLQLYALALYQVSYQDRILGKARMFPLISSPISSDRY